MVQHTKKQKSKRVSPETRRDKILQAGAELFFSKGFAATSLDDIIARAGGSRRFIYTEFGGKKELYQAVVAQRAEKFFPLPAPPTGKNLREALVEVAHNLLEKMFDPAILQAARIATTDCLQFPEVARIHFELRPRTAINSVCSLLQQAAARKEIAPLDYELAAGMFISLIRSHIYWQVLFKLRPAPDPRERQPAVESAVNIFLHGITRSPKTL